VVNASLYVRVLPDRVFKISLPDSSGNPLPAEAQQQQLEQGTAGPLASAPCGDPSRGFALSRKRTSLDPPQGPVLSPCGCVLMWPRAARVSGGPCLAGMDYVTSARGAGVRGA